MTADLRSVSSIADLTETLSRPTEQDVKMAAELGGDLIVLGAAGKMGPTLVQRITRAIELAGRPYRVFAVSRFSDEAARAEIESTSAKTIAADLLHEEQLARLPDVPNVIYLAGMKFGSTGNEPLTWAMNCYLPACVAKRFKGSRIVALSTGNVYGETAVSRGGSKETDELRPDSEYAQSCIGRERMFEYFSALKGTPVCLVRLNYAVEARYGVLLDIARKVYSNTPIDLTIGYVNVIWQGDANSVCFRALQQCESPARVLNLTGPEVLSVRELAQAFARRFGIDPVFVAEEGRSALLSDASLCREILGLPVVPLEEIVELVSR